MTPTASDRDLVLAFKAGEPDAFDAIDRRHRPAVARVVRRMLVNPDDQQEAIQETMTRVLRALPSFNGRYLLDAWVTRIATNVCLDVIRKSTRRPTNVELTAVAQDRIAVDDLRVIHTPDPGEVVEQRDESRRVIDLLRALPENHREALVLREYEGYSHEEIADAMGTTAPRAKALLHRAKKGFRAAWNGEGSLGAPRVLIPLLAAIRFFGRIGDRASNVDVSNAIATASTSVAQVAAAPAVTTSAYALSERVTAGATAVVAALGMSATVATKAYTERKKPPAQTIVLEDERSPRPVNVAAAPPVKETEPRLTPSPSPATSPSEEPSPSEDEAGAPAVTGPDAGELPGTQPGDDDEAEPSPSASPEPSPSPQPSASGPPQPRPAPGFSFAMRANHSSPKFCACDPSTKVEKSETSKNNKRFRFDQTIRGAVFDAEGDAAWQTRLQYWGSADHNTGEMVLGFTLRQDDEEWYYKAYGNSGVAVKNVDGGVTYTFEGDYSLHSGKSDGRAPTGGSISIFLDVWEDGSTVYGVRVALQ